MNTNKSEFIRAANLWVEKVNKCTDFEELYEVLFGKKIQAAKQIMRLHDFEWFDPDETYETDVRAFVAAMKNEAENMSQSLTIEEKIYDIIMNREDLDWNIGLDGYMDAETLAIEISKFLKAE